MEECIKHQLTVFFDVKDEPDKVGKNNIILMQDANTKCGISPELTHLLQAASALHKMYKKFPVLYNTSLVSSFEPKVVYKVRGSPLS